MQCESVQEYFPCQTMVKTIIASIFWWFDEVIRIWSENWRELKASTSYSISFSWIEIMIFIEAAELYIFTSRIVITV